MEQLKQTIFDMLTENTGTHMLDSGGDGGRMWQRNQGLTVETLERAPSASLEIYHSERHGYSLEPTINVYHFLRDNLDLNKRCIEFNALPVRDWGGDVYGLSRGGQEWLENRGFEFGESFNTYNWESNLSQVLQFTYVQSPDWGLYGGQGDERGDYLLLQVHGGADVRGGYTDAKLFVIDCEYFGYEACGFAVELPDADTDTPDMFTGAYNNGYLTLDWHGEWIGDHGSCACDEYLDEFARIAFDGLESQKTSVIIAGDAYE